MSGTTTNGDDLIIGSPFNDALRGELGNDTLLGNGGLDELRGHQGDDRLEGGAGLDRLYGSDGADTLTGDGDTDSLYGNIGADSLLGGEGNDVLDGGVGPDTMLGGAGRDRYFVDDINDVVIDLPDETGNDVTSLVSWTLGAGFSKLLLVGGRLALDGTGNALDNWIEGNAGANLLRGLLGNDTLIGGNGNDTVDGGDGNDNLTGGIGADTIVGGAGNDSLSGQEGNDTIEGGAGNDFMSGYTGADSMAGGAGDDDYVVEDATDLIVELPGGGTDLVYSAVSWTLAAEFEHLYLTGSGNISGAGNSVANRITGNLGANRLTGLDGADTLDGGTGADTMEGGAGDDIYLVDNEGDRIVEAAGAGIDVVTAAASFTLSAHVEHLTLTGGATSGTGNALGNRLTGNGMNNLLAGVEGNDTIEGDAGADTLTGGLGADRLRGGAGADVFVYDAVAEGRDRIIGYNGLEDMLVVRVAAFGGGLTTSTDLLLQGRYIASDTPTATSAAGVGQFIWESDVGRLWWDADGAGGARAALIALMRDAVGMNAYEILLV